VKRKKRDDESYLQFVKIIEGQRFENLGNFKGEKREKGFCSQRAKAKRPYLKAGKEARGTNL